VAFKKFFSIKKDTEIKKIGLALGSGGAKGMGHLGALKAFEEENIKFDIITGTSIGSIIGSMYAKGYSSVDILELLKTINISDIKRFIMIRMDMLNAQNVINDLMGEMNIEDLKIPFAAVSVDLNSGREIVFKKGNVAKAVSASSAFAPFFKPVEIDGMALVDGAYINAIPSDVAKEMGADYIIGIDLSSYKLTETSSKKFLDEFFPTNKIAGKNSRLKGYEYADVMLTPDLKIFKSTSLAGSEEMFEAGYLEAKSKMEQIKEDLSKLGLYKEVDAK
jgi:NTE family protein